MAFDVIGAIETLTTHIALRKPPFVSYQVRLNFALAELGIAPKTVNRRFYTGLVLFGLHADFSPRELAALVFFLLRGHDPDPVAQTKVRLWERRGRIRPGLAIIAGDVCARIWEEVVRGSGAEFEAADQRSTGETGEVLSTLIIEPKVIADLEPVVSAPHPSAPGNVTAIEHCRLSAPEGDDPTSAPSSSPLAARPSESYRWQTALVFFLFLTGIGIIMATQQFSGQLYDLANSFSDSLSDPELPDTADEASSGGGTECVGDTLDIIKCLHSRFLVVDKDLNEVYRDLMNALEINATESAKQPLGNAIQSDVELLRDAQRAWIDYKVKECKRQRALAGGGTASPVYDLHCQINVTKERTKILRDEVDDLL